MSPRKPESTVKWGSMILRPTIDLCFKVLVHMGCRLVTIMLKNFIPSTKENSNNWNIV